MNKVTLDCILWVLASPILFIKWLFWLRECWEFWRVSYAAKLICKNCKATVWLVGMWRCSCGYTYKGHILRDCPVCRGWPRMIHCFACGVTEKLPGP